MEFKKADSVIIGNAIVEYKRNQNEICLLNSLRINGVEVNMFHLGVSKDINVEIAPPTGCGSRRFIANKNYPDTYLDKFHVTRKEMDEILEYLENELYIGFCKHCK